MDEVGPAIDASRERTIEEIVATLAVVLFAALLIAPERFGQTSYGDFARNGLLLAISVLATVLLVGTDRRIRRRRRWLVWLAGIVIGLPLVGLGMVLFIGLLLLASDPNVH